MLDQGLRNARSAFPSPRRIRFPLFTLCRIITSYSTRVATTAAAAASSQPRAKRDFGFCEERVFTEQSSTISHSHRDFVRNNEVRASSAMSVIVGSERHVCICVVRVAYVWDFIKHAIFRYFQWTVLSSREKIINDLEMKFIDKKEREGEGEFQ